MTRIDNTATADAAARQRLLADTAIAEHTTVLNGISTAYLEAGDGPPLVLLHGPGEFKERWIRVIPSLARHHRVVAPDFPGHGQSANRPDGLDVDTVFSWIDALIDKCCDARPVMV